MFTSWHNHCYRGPCEFSRTEDSFTIQTDVPDGRGSWYSYADPTPAAGEQFLFQGQVDGPGFFIILFYSGDEVTSSLAVEHDIIITIPPDVDRLRLDLRLWNAQGTAVFSNISLEPYEPPPTDPALPIPPPDNVQKHHVTGYKWGRNIFLLVHTPEDEPSVPPEFAEPYTVKGHQAGRNVYLEIGFPFYADADPQGRRAPEEESESSEA